MHAECHSLSRREGRCLAIVLAYIKMISYIAIDVRYTIDGGLKTVLIVKIITVISSGKLQQSSHCNQVTYAESIA